MKSCFNVKGYEAAHKRIPKVDQVFRVLIASRKSNLMNIINEVCDWNEVNRMWYDSSNISLL